MWIRPLYTCIRHSPVMRVYMGYLKIQVYTRLSNKLVLFESTGSEDKRPNWSGRKSWSRSWMNGCRLSETILRCVRLQPDWFVITPICCRRDRKRSAERHFVIPSATLSVVDIFSKPIFPEMTRSRTKWYWTSICLEVFWWTGFFDKATTLWLSL